MAQSQKSASQSAHDTSSRDLILKAVGDLMTDTQSVDVSLSEVGKKSGLNPALVNYYFGSKSRMMFELVLEVIGPSVDRLDDLIKMDIPAAEKLEIHFKAIVNTFFNSPFVNRLLHRVSRLDDGAFAKDLAKKIVIPMHEAEQKILEQGAREGTFRRVDPMFFFFQVTGACDSIFHARYALQHAFGKKSITKKMKDEYTDEIVKLVLHGIKV